MLDLKFIRDNQDIVQRAADNKGVKVNIAEFLELDKKRRRLLSSVEVLRAEQNKKSKGKPSDEDIESLKTLKNKLQKAEEEFDSLEVGFSILHNSIPNIPSDDTPIGSDESANKVLRQVGKIPKFDFEPKEHWQIGRDLDIIDNERAAKVSGARFAYLKGGAAMLEFALVQYAFSVLTNEKVLKKIIKSAGLKLRSTPFVPIIPPVLIKEDVMHKMARLEPKEERYHIPSDNLYLVGSAEHTIGAMYIDEVLEEDQLPIRYIGFSTAFRREAGSYGKDTKGIIRVHQFDKLEMESFTMPEDSVAEQDFIVAIQEYLVSSLGLPYQVVAICTGDMGGPDARQIDIETWMPGQNKYRETHTSDMMTDYQARRLNTRVKLKDRKSVFVHMNDATAFAGRTIIAILENYQTKKGTVTIPKVLRKYMNGVKEIK